MVTFTVLFCAMNCTGPKVWQIANTGLCRRQALRLAEILERRGNLVHLEPL